MDEAVWISFHANVFGKSRNLSVSPPAIVEQTQFFSLIEETSTGEGKQWIQNSFTLLKNWPCFVSCSLIS